MSRRPAARRCDGSDAGVLRHARTTHEHGKRHTAGARGALNSMMALKGSAMGSCPTGQAASVDFRSNHLDREPRIVTQERSQQVGSSPASDSVSSSGPFPTSAIGSKQRTPSGWAIGLPTVWPELLASVGTEDRALAERVLMMPLLAASDEDLGELMSSHTPEAFDFLIADGVVLKQTTLARQSALELLGPGDLLAPPLTAARQLESRSVSRYLAHGQVSLVAMNARFWQTARHWPKIADVLHERLGRQTHRASTHTAMLALPRVEDRLVALFGDLAERFGRVSPIGILVDLSMTHEIIGGLVGSRRPTVSLALKQLASQGLIERHDHDRWVMPANILSI